MQGLVCLAIGVVVLIYFVVPIFKSLRDPKPAGDDEQEICKRCRYDVRGVVRCPECGSQTPEGRRQALAKLREQWPSEHIKPRHPRLDETPVIVLMTDDGWAARLLSEHLEARGISTDLNRAKRSHGAVYAEAKESFRLTVWSDDEERARAIIQRLWPTESIAETDSTEA